MPQIELPSLEAVVSLSRCETPPPVPVVTTGAPVREDQSLYVFTGFCLYAVNAADGAARWCQHVKLIRACLTNPLGYATLVLGAPWSVIAPPLPSCTMYL